MLKSLLKLYAMVVVAAALALIGVNKSFVWLFHDTLTHGEREVRKGYAFVLQEYLDRADRTDPAGRDAAIARMRMALTEIIVEGIKTNVPLHRDIVHDAAFRAGGTNIHYLERKLAEARG